MLVVKDLGERARITVRFRNHANKEWITVGDREGYELEVDTP